MDMRVYDGCPSDELREHLEYVAEKEALLKDKFPEAIVTYFPVEPAKCAGCGEQMYVYLEKCDEELGE